MSLSARLKQMREEQSLTQSDIQALTKFKQKDISKYESGKAKFIPEEYILFWNKRGYNINWIYTGKNPKMESEQKLSVKDLLDTYERFQKMESGIISELKNFVFELCDLILAPIYDDLEKNDVKDKRTVLLQKFKDHRLIKKTVSQIPNEYVEEIVDGFLKRKLE